MARFIPRDEARKEKLKNVLHAEAATAYEARQKRRSEENRERKIQQRLEPQSKPREITNAKDAVNRYLDSFGRKSIKLARISRDQLQRQSPLDTTEMKDKMLAQVVANTRDEIKSAIDRYNKGKINHGLLSEILNTSIRREAIASAIIGVGGVGNLTDNVLVAVQRQVAQQLAYVKSYLDELSADRIMQLRDESRGLRFADIAQSIAQTATRQSRLDESFATGTQLEERRVLSPGEACEDCVDLADKWEPFGVLPPPGTATKCGNNCECTMETRAVADVNSNVNAAYNESEGYIFVSSKGPSDE